MKVESIKNKVEIYICNHQRSDDENCFEKGAKEMTDVLKKWAKEEHKGDIKVYRSGCLGKCSEGIAIACYPAKTLLLEVKPGDTEEIKQGLKEALKKA